MHTDVSQYHYSKSNLCTAKIPGFVCDVTLTPYAKEQRLAQRRFVTERSRDKNPLNEHVIQILRQGLKLLKV